MAIKQRRDFLKKSLMGMLGGSVFSTNPSFAKDTKPIVVSTWNFGLMANEVAWEILQSGGAALDAVEEGVRVIENDPENHTVGIGGYPDRDGNVTLDACIMDHRQRCGSVAFLQHIRHPVSVARKVMEETPHVMLVGAGALEFALRQGFVKEHLLTPEVLKKWQENYDHQFKPVINIENHDTIGMLAIDAQGNLSGSCTTSGAANKLYGRVGDSPLIGAGLFVDNEVGACCATGLGEAVIRHAGSAMVVELMRQGIQPTAACKQVLQRIQKTHPDLDNLQVGFLALRKDGVIGAYGIHKGFNYAHTDLNHNDVIDAKSLI